MPAKRRNLLFRTITIFGAGALALALVEIAARLTLPDLAPQHLRARDRLHYDLSAFSRHVFEAGGQTVHDPEEPDEILYEINALGYRGPEFAAEKPAEEVRIVILGGSAVFDPRQKTGRDWPRRVERMLREAGSGNACVVNAGVPGHASSDALGRLVSEIHAFSPDVVLFYNVWNDAKLLRPLGAGRTLLRAVRPFQPEDDPRLYARNALDALLCRSRLYSFVRLRVLERRLDIGEEGAASRDEGGENPAEGDGPAAARDPLAAFESRPRNEWRLYARPLEAQFLYNFRNLVDAARNAGIRPVLVTPARLVHADNPPEDVARIRARYIGVDHKRLVRLLDSLDGLIRHVGEEKNCPVLDLSARLSGRSDLFHDHIHLTDAGSEAVAREVAAFLRAEFPDLLGEEAP